MRKVDVSKEQIGFSYEVDTHLSQCKFDKINHIYPTKKKQPYAMVGDECYVMQHYLATEETDFKEMTDLIGIIQELALFHKLAVDVKSDIRKPEQSKIKNVYEYYKKRQQQNNKLKKNMAVLKQKSNFELMFLDECEDYRKLEELALGTISEELGCQLIQQVIDNKTIAHRDFTYHTITKSHGGYSISNIDMCNYDIQILDLSQILSKIMQKNEWNKEILFELIKQYDDVRTISDIEMKLLKFMMIYPDKFNSICVKYMASKRRWNYSMFEQKWENMLVYKDNQIDVAQSIINW